MTISEFLVWIAGGGSLIVASWVLGQISWYNTLVDKIKQWVFFILAVLFGGGSYAITQYVGQSTLTAIAPYFLIASFIFIAVFINKTYVKINDVLKTLEKLNSKK